jgi:hypothetical protein
MKAKEGNCALCNNVKKLSFEHIPPESAFNNKPIYIQGYDHLKNENSHVFGKRMKSNKGFGAYTLCESCNNNTGGWYARDFAEFARQGMQILQSKNNPQHMIKGDYNIKPLNVLKQILTMFMSADKSNHLRTQKELVHFILSKDERSLPLKYRVFLYSNCSHTKRFIGYTIVNAGRIGVQKWSEINFQPFGYLLAEESEPAHKVF